MLMLVRLNSMARPLKCRHKPCNKYGERESMRIVPLGAFCDDDCALGYAKAQNEKRQAAMVKAARKDRAAKVRNFREKDKTHQLKITQRVVNRLCALLDAGKPCISCGRPDEGGRKRNASHYKSRGASSGLRFDLRNLHGACCVCNEHLSGNIAGFQRGLLERYGPEILEYLESAERLKAWTIDELADIRRIAAEEVRRLESGQSPSRNWRSINAAEPHGRGE
jgi:hypothetical protein